MIFYASLLMYVIIIVIVNLGSKKGCYRRAPTHNLSRMASHYSWQKLYEGNWPTYPICIEIRHTYNLRYGFESSPFPVD